MRHTLAIIIYNRNLEKQRTEIVVTKIARGVEKYGLMNFKLRTRRVPRTSFFSP